MRRAPAVWLLLAALAIGVIAMERAGVFAPPPPTDAHGHALDAGPRYLVGIPVDRWAAAEIVVDGAARRFDRGSDGLWRHGAAGGAEESARIAGALEVFARARVTREVSASRDVAAYGVLAPRLSVALWTEDRDAPAARYAFGDLAPDELSRYVLLFGEFLTVTVPEYHAANLVDLAAGFAAPEG